MDKIAKINAGQLSKRQVLQALSFGSGIAEDEVEQLIQFFVKTDQWQRLFNGSIDIVYGPKGSGKSALYAFLDKRKAELQADKNILLISAEKPRGTPVFKDVAVEPPTSETEFVGLWKLYFLSLVGNIVLRERKGESENVDRALDVLNEAGLVDADMTLARTLKNVREYLKRALSPDALEGTMQIDPASGLPKGFGVKITLGQPSSAAAKRGVLSADEVFELCDLALKDLACDVWVVLDRLDVAFQENEILEENALRALFKAYSDLRGLEKFRLKIFLRNDIWKRITDKGFREASHVTKHVTIEWSEKSILNLVIRRLVANDLVCKFYNVKAETVLRSDEEQEKLFYRVFPPQVRVGEKQPNTLDWILTRTWDGGRTISPREVIQFLNEARSKQVQALERGENDPDGSHLFSPPTLKSALPEVSRTRLEKTLFAEYPQFKKLISGLISQKTLQTVETLAKIWGVSKDDARKTADALVGIGFFEQRGNNSAPEYWVPFLYRDGLKMSQGAADNE